MKHVIEPAWSQRSYIMGLATGWAAGVVSLSLILILIKVNF